MSRPSAGNRPEAALETVLDVVFFAPLGLVLSLGEEVPRLAAKGRGRLGPQLSTARIVGEFAVKQGQRQLGRWLDSVASPPRPIAGSASSMTGPPPSVTTAPLTPPARPPVSPPSEPLTDRQPPRDHDPVPPSPAAIKLGIPGYDSLSASQVVQRLAGLSAKELEAVRRHEASGRGRRTILTRISQLQGA